MATVDVKISNFEGPLDLLLHLIDKNKYSIFDIPIVEITAQYLAYLDDLSEEDYDRMSKDDNWFTAQQALELGFIDEIINTIC